jgi:hypothetical protein
MPVLARYLQFYLQYTCSSISLAKSSVMFQAKNGVPFLGSQEFSPQYLPFLVTSF